MKKHKALWIGVIGLLVVLLALNLKVILIAIGDFLVLNVPPQEADLILALGGNPARAKYAIKLHQQGFSPYLFFTGYSNKANQPRPYLTEPEQMARAEGVMPGAIIPFSSQAKTTYDEAVELQQVLADYPNIQSVMIISDPYHLRRVRWVFRRVLGETSVQLYYVSIPLEEAQYHKNWWHYKHSRQWVRSEYLKFLYSRLVY